MADEPIPADLRYFILQHIDSVTQLEALLLLRGSPDEVWNLSTAAKRLYTTEQEVLSNSLRSQCLDRLKPRRLAGRVVPEEDADAGGEQDRERDGVSAEKNRPTSEPPNSPGGADS
jgi:hypothetical protein